jgi:hypothetical protein
LHFDRVAHREDGRVEVCMRESTTMWPRLLVSSPHDRASSVSGRTPMARISMSVTS